MKFCVFFLTSLMPLATWAQSTAPKAGASAPSTAKPAASAPDPKKVPVIEEIFRQTKPEGMVNNMLNGYKGAFSQAAARGFETEVRKFDDPNKYKADFAQLQERVFGLLASKLDWQKLKPQFVQVYSDTFTLDELNGMLAFYKSPSGHAFLEKEPGAMQKWGQVSEQQVRDVGPQIQKMMNDSMADIKKRSAASSPKPPAK